MDLPAQDFGFQAVWHQLKQNQDMSARLKHVKYRMRLKRNNPKQRLFSGMGGGNSRKSFVR